MTNTHGKGKVVCDSLQSLVNRSVFLRKRASLVAQFNSWVGKIPWRRARLPTPAKNLAFEGQLTESKEQHD